MNRISVTQLFELKFLSSGPPNLSRVLFLTKIRLIMAETFADG